VNNADETFYRRFTLPEEQKNGPPTSIERFNSHRWFVSPNVVKLEAYRQPGEMGRILERLRCRNHDEAAAAVANILAEARRP
jgi:hypothetical protein